MSEVNNDYNIGNRLIRSNDKSFDYDKDGNQIQAGDTSFEYMTSHVNGNNVKRLKSVYENKDFGWVTHLVCSVSLIGFVKTRSPDATRDAAMSCPFSVSIIIDCHDEVYG